MSSFSITFLFYKCSFKFNSYRCDIGVPGSGTCSNCHKHQMVCIFSPVTSRGSDASSTRPEDALLTPQYQPQPPQYHHHHQQQQHLQQPYALEHYALQYPLLCIKDGQVGYEADQLITFTDKHPVDQPISSLDTSNFQEPSLQLESKLFSIYFQQVHPAFPVLLKQSVLNIHSQDRLLLSKLLRYAIMTIACHFYPKTASTPYNYPHNQDVSSNNTTAANCFYDIARKELDATAYTKKLDVVQSLLLLYKHNEIMYKDGTRYLEQAQEIASQLSSVVPQQQEMINRTRWVLFGIIGLSSLSDPRYSAMYKRIDLPVELPQALQEEIKDDNSAQQHVNRFAQIANLSVLYSHTVQSLITCSPAHLICLTQFKEIRQHWHDSLHPVTQSRLLTSQDQEQDMDIMILYSAILYDMLYLLLVLHYRLIETEWESIETAYRLQRMVHNWVTRASFMSTVQCRRMASFALMLSLQLQISRDKIDVDFIQQVRQTLQYIKIDSQIDSALQELVSSQAIAQAPPPMDYFSLVPQPIMHSTSSSPLDIPSSSTPGLWDILSTTTNGGLSTPMKEEDRNQTSDWILDQRRQQQQQQQMYELQQQMSYFTPILPGTNSTGNSNGATTTTAATTATATATDTDTDYSYLIPDIWSPTTIENLNQMKI